MPLLIGPLMELLMPHDRFLAPLVLGLFALAPQTEAQLTSADTLVTEIFPGLQGGKPFPEAHFGDQIVFRSTDGAGTQSVWISDGSAATTVKLMDFPTSFGDPTNFAQFGERLIWTSGSRFYSSDGTPEGTAEFFDADDLFNVDFVLWSRPLGDTGKGIIAVRQFLFGMHFFLTDGTTAGTSDIIEISNAQTPVSIGDKIYFGGEQSFSSLVGLEPWVTDGTAEGTHIIKDLGSDTSQPNNFVEFQGEVFFQARGAIWKTDGTEGGTVEVVDPDGGKPQDLVVLGDKLLFHNAFSFNGQSWATDGTAAGTEQLTFVGTSSALVGVPTLPFVVGGSLAYFVAEPVDQEFELWRTDGTVAGTFPVTDVPFWSPFRPAAATTDDRLLFLKDSPGSGNEVWMTQGTPESTAPFAELAPGSASSDPFQFFRAGVQVFFNADDGATGEELHSITIAETGGWIVENFGVGCGSGEPPAITSSLTPTLGDDFGIGVEGTPGVPVSLFLSADPFFEALGGGCAGLIKSPLLATVLVTDGTGKAELLTTLPDIPPLAGLPFSFQAALLTGVGPYGGLDLTGGLEVVLGP
ncbi:MAG: hypothetical protein AAF682_04580 [Planctomycetota bacterium]